MASPPLLRHHRLHPLQLLLQHPLQLQLLLHSAPLERWRPPRSERSLHSSNCNNLEQQTKFSLEFDRDNETSAVMTVAHLFLSTPAPPSESHGRPSPSPSSCVGEFQHSTCQPDKKQIMCIYLVGIADILKLNITTKNLETHQFNTNKADSGGDV